MVKDEEELVNLLQLRFRDVKDNIRDAALRVRRDPDAVKIVAVSKNHPIEIIQAALKAGIYVFGENYAQEFRDKLQLLSLLEPLNVVPEWHFIGHLQSNKLKYIVNDVNLIHSVDTLRLAEEISIFGAKLNRTFDVLLQIKTSEEGNKFGCDSDDALEFARNVLQLPNIRVCGLMTIAEFSDNSDHNRICYALLRELRDEIRGELAADPKITSLTELSMGMSGDYVTAVEEGATIVRIGTTIFGEREYKV